MDKKEFALKQHEEWEGKLKLSAEQRSRHRKTFLLPIHLVLRNHA